MAYNKQHVYEQSLERIHGWIKAADQKISILMGSLLAISGLILPDLITFVHENYLQIKPYSIALFASGLVLVIYGLFKCLGGLQAKLTLNKKLMKKDRSTSYFMHIAEMKTEDYCKKMKNLKKDEHINDILSQIHASAIIAKHKHESFNDALRVSFLGFIFVSLSVILMSL